MDASYPTSVSSSSPGSRHAHLLRSAYTIQSTKLRIRLLEEPKKEKDQDQDSKSRPRDYVVRSSKYWRRWKKWRKGYQGYKMEWAVEIVSPRPLKVCCYSGSGQVDYPVLGQVGRSVARGGYASLAFAWASERASAPPCCGCKTTTMAPRKASISDYYSIRALRLRWTIISCTDAMVILSRFVSVAFV